MRAKRLSANLAAALAFIMLAATALAAVDIDDTTKEVFANGHAITIEASGTNTVVKSEEADAGLASEGRVINGGYTIYGGSNNKSIEDDTSITIEGGTVGTIYGGGHAAGSGKSAQTGERNITIEGGSITGDVFGGGHAVAKSGEAAPNADLTSPENITISGGSINGNIYLAGYAQTFGDAGASANVNANANITIVDKVIGEKKIISKGKVDNPNRAVAYYQGYVTIKHEEAPKPQTITTTFKYGNYDTNNVFHQVGAEDKHESTLKHGESDTVTSSRTQTECYEAAGGSRTVKYDDKDDVIYIILKLREYPFEITYVYYEGDDTSNAIQTDVSTGNVTCSGTLTTNAFGLKNDEYEVVGTVPDPYEVTHKGELVKTFYIKVAKKQTGGGDTPGGGDNPGGDNPGGETGGETQIPLGPGTAPTNQRIPLGAPRTGGSVALYGFAAILGLAGAFSIKSRKR